MTRREIREAAFLLLFETEISKETIEEAVEAAVEDFEMDMDDDVLKTVNGVRENQEEIDAVIAKYSTTRAVSRIPKVNLTVMRIAIYEILKCDNVPAKVAINEAIELTKKYADDKDRSFVSGVLGSYFKELDIKDKHE